MIYASEKYIVQSRAVYSVEKGDFAMPIGRASFILRPHVTPAAVPLAPKWLIPSCPSHTASPLTPSQLNTINAETPSPKNIPNHHHESRTRMASQLPRHLLLPVHHQAPPLWRLLRQSPPFCRHVPPSTSSLGLVARRHRTKRRGR